MRAPSLNGKHANAKTIVFFVCFGASSALFTVLFQYQTLGIWLGYEQACFVLFLDLVYTTYTSEKWNIKKPLAEKRLKQTNSATELVEPPKAILVVQSSPEFNRVEQEEEADFADYNGVLDSTYQERDRASTISFDFNTSKIPLNRGGRDMTTTANGLTTQTADTLVTTQPKSNE